jgi:hypothetical protein
MKFITIKRSRIFGTAIVLALAFSAVGPRMRVAGAASPNQQPVAFNTTLVVDGNIIGCATGAGCQAGGQNSSYFVPQGKLLVIQQLTATVFNFSNITGRCGAFLVIDQNQASAFPIVLSQQDNNNFGTNLVGGEAYGFAGSQQVTIYLNAGQRVDFAGTRADAGAEADYDFSFYGYLVDAP